MLRKYSLIIAMIIGMYGFAALSEAKLTQVGPIDPKNGFPIWCSDTAGQALELCLDPVDPITGLGPCPLSPPIAGNPYSVQTGFGDEAFWSLVSTNIRGGGLNATLVIALEGTYRTGVPVKGDQISFGRVRIRGGNFPVDGVYTFVHPYGTYSVNVVAADAKRASREVNYTSDIGIGAPGDFTGALKSAIGPFLRWTAPDYPYVDPATGNSYLGNPNFSHAITGSPMGTNYFQIIGPPGAVLDDVTGGNVITETLFSVSGKIAARRGVGVERAVYSLDSAGNGFVDVFASSVRGQQITAQLPGAAPVNMVPDGSGKYYARIPFTAVLSPRPTTVKVSNLTDNPVMAVNAAITDQVTITGATFDPASKTLRIAARSSHTGPGAPTLSATGYPGAFTGGVLTVPGAPYMPAKVSVVSTSGGSHTETVSYASSGHAPKITSQPVTIATPANRYRYAVNAADFDPGELITYSLSLVTNPPTVPPAPLPTGLGINGTTGLITWVPSLLQLGFLYVESDSERFHRSYRYADFYSCSGG